MVHYFGAFIEQQEESGEYLKIGFAPNTLPLPQRQRNNGLTAAFLADYLSTFFPAEDSEAARRQSEIKDAVSYLVNELLETAMRFSDTPSTYSVVVEMVLMADVIRLYATHRLDVQRLEPFQQFIHRVLSEDPAGLDREQLERHEEADPEETSALGFLTMLNDYGATLAWKLEDPGQSSDGMTVTTMVQLAV